MDVSKNSGTPKSSTLIDFSILNHPFWGTIIFGNTQNPVPTLPVLQGAAALAPSTRQGRHRGPPPAPGRPGPRDDERSCPRRWSRGSNRPSREVSGQQPSCPGGFTKVVFVFLWQVMVGLMVKELKRETKTNWTFVGIQNVVFV